MANLDQVMEQMYAAGMPSFPGGAPIADGRVHRYHGRPPKAYYKLYEFQARNGVRYVSGWFGFNGQFDLTKIERHYEGISPDEYKRLQATQVQLEVREREKREKRVRFASGRAREQWRAGRARLAEGETVPYLVHKRLQWEKGLRVYTDGTLLVPMVRYDVGEDQDADPDYTGPRRLAGLQKIAPDGTKRFNKGMDPVGAACRFGDKPKDGDLLLVGEGLATVLTVHQGLERVYTCFVAFTAGNLLPVARILRKLYPKSAILFLADDDAYLEAQLNKRLRNDWGVRALYKVLDGEAERVSDTFGTITVRADVHEDGSGTPVLTAGIRSGEKLRTMVLTNTGRTKAREAMAELGNAWLVWPTFTARALSIDPDTPRLTDFNDLHAADGIEQAARQVADTIKHIEDSIELARGIAAGVVPSAEAVAGTADGGKGSGEGGVDWKLHWNLLNRFTLIERSGTAYDAETGFLWRIEHMKLSFGAAAVMRWLNSSRRKTVDMSQVVFDPTGEADPKTTVNLYRGLKLKPADGGSCTKLLELLHYLCCEHPEDTNTPVTDWVLFWIAFLVQHVGAKMATAIVMYGPEGTGKNLFWSALQDIFGEYAALIGQSELEDKHNTWLSAKLFLVANEVVTRSEMSHHVGRLKNLITEPRVYINPKMIDQRYERNHCNLVFCSNEFQPLKISPDDRRYMVIRTPGKLDKDFYLAVAAELKAGAAAALLRYLLDLDLQGFYEHSEPIMTRAKEQLIEIGMSSSQLFWAELKSGDIGLPYCPALVSDVYDAYTTWCQRSGFKMPEAINRFTPAFMSMNGVRRLRPRVRPPAQGQHLVAVGDDVLRQRKTFVMGERRAGQEGLSDVAWLQAGVNEFHERLLVYRGGDDARSARQWSPNRTREAF